MFEITLSNSIAIIIVLVCVAVPTYLFIQTGKTTTLLEKGMNLLQAGNYDEAIQIFRQVKERQQSNDMVRLLLGKALIKQKQLEEAIPTFQELIERSPKNIDAYIGLGEVYFKQGKTEEAIATLEKAKALHKAKKQNYDYIDEILQELHSQTQEIDNS